MDEPALESQLGKTRPRGGQCQAGGAAGKNESPAGPEGLRARFEVGERPTGYGALPVFFLTFLAKKTTSVDSVPAGSRMSKPLIW